MTRRHVWLFVLLCALWGFSFVALKVALRHADPIFLASIRFWLPGVIVLLYCAFTGRPLVPARGRWLGVALLGVINTGVLALFLNLGQKEISAALGAILLYTYPLMQAVVSPIFLDERIDRWKVGGLLAGFAGIMVIAGFGGGGSTGGVVSVLLAAVCWAGGTVIFKKIIPDQDVYMVTAWNMLFGAAFLSIISAAVEGMPFFQASPAMWLSYLWMTLPGMALAGTLWYWLLERGEAASASAYMFMTPVFGVFFGWAVLGDSITWRLLAGGALVAAAIYLVNRSAQPAADTATASARAA